MMTKTGKILFTIAAVAIASAVIIGISIYLGAITIPDFGGNGDHAYGEPVGDVVSPGLDECALNGYYYPVSSGKCTINVTGSIEVVGSGGAGGIVAIMPSPTSTPWPEDLKAENQTHETYCYESQHIGTASGVAWDYVCKTIPLPNCNGTWYHSGVNSTSMVCVNDKGEVIPS